MSIKSDGNGGLVIKKGTFAVILSIITILGVLASMTAYATGIQSNVEQNTITLSEQNPVVYQNKENIAVIQNDINTIKTDLKDIKSLLTNNGGR